MGAKVFIFVQAAHAYTLAVIAAHKSIHNGRSAYFMYQMPCSQYLADSAQAVGCRCVDHTPSIMKKQWVDNNNKTLICFGDAG